MGVAIESKIKKELFQIKYFN